MSAVGTARQTAVIMAPSTNTDVSVTITSDAATSPMVGQMMFVEQPITLPNGDSTTELGLGTVTEVTTRNPALESDPTNMSDRLPMLRDQLMGPGSDARLATIRLQASYRRDTDTLKWRPAGANLSTSPNTGVAVREVTNEVVEEIVTLDGVHYMGHMAHAAARGAKIRVPLDLPDFAGPRGAAHVAICGVSGAGKSAMSSLYFAARMVRFPDHCVICVDPQGQWAHEQGLPYSLQGLSVELGREVIVARISEDLKLTKDASLFMTLLSKTRFLKELMRMSAENAEDLLEEMGKALRRIDDWDVMTSDDLLVDLISACNNQTVINKVYATQDRQDRLRDAFDELVRDPDRRSDVLTFFAPMHNLFQDTSPSGAPRRELWGVLQQALDKNARNGAPAPLLILDMSTSDISWLSSLLASGTDQEAMYEALAVLDSDAVKAAILRQTFRTLKRAAESAFRDGSPVDLTIALDEAARYAPPPGVVSSSDPEIAELSRDLGGYARDFRKFGIGLMLILQQPKGLNPDVWAQLTIRFLGYGLGGADLDLVGEAMEDRSQLKLYRGFAPPDATEPPLYPWMVLGSVSPLAVTRAPVFIAAYTDFDEFRSDNHALISARCQEEGLPVMSGNPQRPGVGAIVTRKAKHGPSRKATAQAAATVASNAATGGVDMTQYGHLPSDDALGDPLAGIDDPAPPRVVGRAGRPIDPTTGEEFPF